MTFIESIIVGIVQGLTEFLPISSSGHIVITQNLFGLSSDNIAFEVFVHFGTLLSIVAIYYRDLGKMIVSFLGGLFSRNPGERYREDAYFRLSIFVIIGTIPAVLVGLFLKDFVESIFHNVHLVGWTLIATALILLLTTWSRDRSKEITPPKSLWIGMAQMLAILPGISRSGSTISTALYLGIPRKEAARFSFLLAVPAILGATILETGELLSGTVELRWSILLAGLVAAFIVGYGAILLILRLLQRGKFAWFSVYCFCLGIVVLLYIP